jgi:hypothetical protein
MKMRARYLCVGAAAVGVVWMSPTKKTATTYQPVAVARASETKNKPASKPDKTEAKTLKLFKGYRQWRRVNTEAYYVAPPLAIAGAPAHISKKDGENAASPHVGKFIVVYVNKKGEKSLLDTERKSFPEGTLIVKEKHPSKENKNPELLTAMVKREAGYDSDHGDWQYVSLNGAATKVTASGKLEKCQGCHDRVAEQGYVFGDYIPKKESAPNQAAKNPSY